MMSAPETIDLLRSIDASLKKLVGLAQQVVSQARAAQPKPVASDRDLDGKYGDPAVKFNPRDWAGESCKGLRMSECPPDFLETLASTFDYFAQQAEKNGEMTDRGKPVADFKRADAARARGWAQRNRNGHKPTSQASGWTDEEPWS